MQTVTKIGLFIRFLTGVKRLAPPQLRHTRKIANWHKTRARQEQTYISLRKSRLRFVCKMLQGQGIAVCIWLSKAPSGASCATPNIWRWNLGETLSTWLQPRKEKIPIVLECIRRVDKHLQGATSSTPLGYRP